MRKPLQSHRHARTPSFIEERQGGVGSCYKRKAHWSKLGVPSVVASHCLGRCRGGSVDEKSIFFLQLE